jgi:hypothetical protein
MMLPDGLSIKDIVCLFEVYIDKKGVGVSGSRVNGEACGLRDGGGMWGMEVRLGGQWWGVSATGGEE